MLYKNDDKRFLSSDHHHTYSVITVELLVWVACVVLCLCRSKQCKLSPLRSLGDNVFLCGGPNQSKPFVYLYFVDVSYHLIFKPIEFISETFDFISETFDFISQIFDFISETFELISEAFELIFETFELISETFEFIS